MSMNSTVLLRIARGGANGQELSAVTLTPLIETQLVTFASMLGSVGERKFYRVRTLVVILTEPMRDYSKPRN